MQDENKSHHHSNRRLHASWVVGETEKIFKEVQEVLENYAAEMNDVTLLESCPALLHQVRGSLEMIDLAGVASLANEIKNLIEALVSNQVSNRQLATEILLDSCFQFPVLMSQSIKEHHKGASLIPVAQLNRIREFLGDVPVNELLWFQPHWQGGDKVAAVLQKTAIVEPLDELSKKIRQLFQVALLGVIRNQEIENNLGFLSKALLRLQKVTSGYAIYQLWWVSDVFIESLLMKAVPLDSQVKSILGKIDRQVKIFSASAEPLEMLLPRDLMAEVLFKLASIDSQASKLKQIKRVYQLEKAYNALKINPDERLVHLETNTIQVAMGAVLEEMAVIKDVLDVFVRSGLNDQEPIKEQLSNLKRVADTLALLGLMDGSTILLAQMKLLSEMLETPSADIHQVMLDAAGSILYVESLIQGVMNHPDAWHSSLAELSTQASNIQQKSEAIRFSIEPAPEELSLAQESLLREMRATIDLLGVDLAQYVSVRSEESLVLIRQHLYVLKGACVLLGDTSSITWLKWCEHYFEQVFVHSQGDAFSSGLSLLSDAISALDYYWQHFNSVSGRKNEAPHAALIKIQRVVEALSVVSEQSSALSTVSVQETVSVQTSTPVQSGPSEIQIMEQKLTALFLKESDVDDQAKEIFLEEAEEILAEIKKYQLILKEKLNHTPTLKEYRRAFHTLKGSGRLVGAVVIGELSYAIETLLSRVLDGILSMTEQSLGLFDRCIVILPSMIQSFSDQKPYDFPLIAGIMHDAARFIKGEILEEAPNTNSANDNSSVVQIIETPLQKEVSLSLTEMVILSPEETVLELQEEMEVQGSLLSDAFDSAGEIVLEPVTQLVTELVTSPVLEENNLELVSAKVLEVVPETIINAAIDIDVATVSEDPVLLDIFAKEAYGHLSVIQSFIDSYQVKASVVFTPELFRALHTLKGSSNMAGIDSFSQCVAPIEGLIKNLSKLGIVAEQETIDLLIELVQSLSVALALDQGFQVPAQKVEILAGWVRALKLKYFKSSHEDNTLLPHHPHRQLLPSRLNEGMSLIILAMEYFTEWHLQTAEKQPCHGLLHTLEAIVAFATEVELEAMKDLTLILLECYQVIAEESAHRVEAAFVTLAQQAHECLIEMIDVLVVSGGIPTYPSAFIGALKDFAETWRIERAAQEAKTAEAVTLSIVPESVSIVPEAVSSTIAMPSTASHGEDIIESVTDSELLDIFLEEAIEISEKAAELFHQLKASSANDNISSDLSGILRCLHTLKGGARLSGLVTLGDYVHHLESIYEKVEQHFSEVFLANVLFLARVHDGLQDAVFSLKNESAVRLNSGLYQSLLYLAKNPLVPIEERSALGQSFVAEDNSDKELKFSPAIASTEAGVASTESRSTEKPIVLAVNSDYLPNQKAPEELSLLIPVAKAPKKESQTLPEVDWDVLDIFVNEADELLESMDHFIEEWQRAPDQVEINHSIQRLLHTLKGGGRLSQQELLADLCHHFEDYLQALVVNQHTLTAQHFLEIKQKRTEILTSLDAAKDLYRRYLESDEVQEAHQFEQRTFTNAPSLEEETVEDEGEETVKAIGFSEVQLRELFQQESHNKEPIKVQNDLLENIVNLVGETSVQRGLVEQEIHDFSRILEELAHTVNRLKEQLRSLELEAEAQILSQYEVEKTSSRYEGFDPLEMDRYSQLNYLTRGLSESASDIQDIKDSLLNKVRDAEYGITRLGRTNREVQEGLLRVRMTPLSRIMPKLRKLVRQVSQELGKEVELDVVNPEGELDRSVLEKITVPFEHMIRNAIDHGIELREDRMKKGKSPIGRITLEINRDGSDIVIILRDDGKGIPIEAVRKKAIDLNMMTQEVQLSDDDILQFIFKPGFSTAEKVTQISGRGVGMDVVYNEIKQLNGTMKIQSERDQGTQFIIRLPFTVSITRVLMVTVSDELYAIPLTQIEGVTRVNPSQLRACYHSSGSVFSYNEQNYRLLYLGYFVQNVMVPDLTGFTRPLPVLLVRGGAELTAIQVDSVIGAREIVLKSVGKQLSAVSGISGATIMGDGSVVVILELMSLLRAQRAQDSRGLAAGKVSSQHENLVVLVVDDSVTVRKVTSRLLERQGIEVITAKDGVDAMQVMHEMVPDIVLLDVEMPRMDGFEVASQMRHMDRLSAVPIIMITSRTGEKHRQRAESLGVDGYLGKPFQESTLLKVIHSLTAKAK